MKASRRSRGELDGSPARPSWWMLLAVSLAIIAVIFARSPGNPNRKAVPGFHQPRSPVALGHQLTPLLQAHRRPVPRILRLFLDQPIRVQLQCQLGSCLCRPLQRHPRPASRSAAPTTISYPGYLDFPDNVVSSFPVPDGSGELTASASWQVDTTLDLSIACGTDRRSVNGALTATVSMGLVTSPCFVTLAEPGALTTPIAYTVTLTVNQTP